MSWPGLTGPPSENASAFPNDFFLRADARLLGGPIKSGHDKFVGCHLSDQSAQQRTVAQDFLGCVVPRRAGDAAAGMRACAAHIESLDRRAVRTRAKHRARGP